MNEDLRNYIEGTLNGVKEKANQNKTQSTIFFLALIIPTIITPILVLLPVCDIVSKYIPAVLTGIAAFSSTWMQLRKPQERWAMYRTAQREMEYEIDQHKFSLNEYSSKATKDMILADKISKRALQIHYEWLPIFPKKEQIAQITNGDA